MSVNRTYLTGSPAVIKWHPVNGEGSPDYYFHSRDDIDIRHTPVWTPVETSMHGEVDKVQTDFVIKVGLRLWGAWELLPQLFPAWLCGNATTPTGKPTMGQRIFSMDSPVDDHELVVIGRTGEQITYHNAQLTKLSNLHLGLDQPVFSADLEFTVLQQASTTITPSNNYYTIAATTYNAATAAFAKTNFKQLGYTAAWAGKTGFASFQAKDGWTIEWDANLEPEIVNRVGTTDMIVTGFLGRARCIPLEPTQAQIDTAAMFQGTGGGIGTLLSKKYATGTNNLVITGTGVYINLRNAEMTEHGSAWGMKPLRNGEIAWETTVGFTTGTAQPRAYISTAVEA